MHTNVQCRRFATVGDMLALAAIVQLSISALALSTIAGAEIVGIDSERIVLPYCGPTGIYFLLAGCVAGSVRILMGCIAWLIQACLAHHNRGEADKIVTSASLGEPR